MKTDRRSFIKTGLAAGALGALPIGEAGAETEEVKKMDLTRVTYCGLYCGLCATLARIPKQASALLNTLLKEGMQFWGDDDQKALLKQLRSLADGPKNFAGCRGGKCGDPNCEIRKCAAEKKMDVCTSCDEYPCKRFDWVVSRYPTLLADGKRQKEVGLKKWIEEQEARCKTGFCHADIRLFQVQG